jgi:hypothetical protein
MSSLSKRVAQYINNQNTCQIAVGLLIEQRKHLRAANQAAERSVHSLRYFLDVESKRRARYVTQEQEIARLRSHIQDLSKQLSMCMLHVEED